METKLILAIDQSTSGTKAMLINAKGQLVHKRSMDHAQIYPQPGWAEHDAAEIYRNVRDLILCIAGTPSVRIADIAAVALTNQRETVVVWDRHTGEPIYNAIVWQCRRTAERCRELKSNGWERTVKAKTGLTIDPYFSATKIEWILDNVEGARDKALDGDLLAGTMDSWILWKLTGGAVHATDYTNASRTMLFDIYRRRWDAELLELFGIPPGMLPKVKYSDELFGYCTDAGGLTAPICGIIGDSHGALVGQRCFEPGMVKVTYGTGSSLMMNAGKEPVRASEGLVGTIAYAYGGEVHYAVEGIVHSTGDTLKWLKDNLRLFDSFQEAEAMAASLPDNEGVYILPSFNGLGAPYWNPFIQASINGMTRRTNRSHLVRAGIESIVYQIKDVVELMRQEAGIRVSELRVDGGPTTNRFLMQFQADLLGIDVAQSSVPELSAMGAAYLAGLATGVWRGVDEIERLTHSRTVYRRQMDAERSDRYYRGWKSVIRLHTEGAKINNGHMTIDEAAQN